MSAARPSTRPGDSAELREVRGPRPGVDLLNESIQQSNIAEDNTYMDAGNQHQQADDHEDPEKYEQESHIFYTKILPYLQFLL